MNILFITPSLPSRLHRIRALNLIKYLSRSHKIYLASLAYQKNPDPTEFAQYCQKIELVYQSKIRSLLNCLIFLFTSLPLEVAYCRNRKMNEVVREMIKKHSIELVYVKRLRSAQFVDTTIPIPVVLDTTDAMSLYYARAAKNAPRYKKILFWEEELKYRLYEITMLKKFKNWILSSAVDIEYLKEFTPPRTKLFLIPNGVDTEFYKPSADEPKKNTILLSGLMDKFANIEAAEFFFEEIFLKIQGKIPDAKVYVVGPSPPRKIKRYTSEHIFITGAIPDIREYITQASVVVVPIKTGAGTRNKILQAWSMGRPVVTTSKGAEGLEASRKEHVLVADDPDDFAKKVVSVLQNKNLANQLVGAGYQIVRQKYSMENIVRSLNDLFVSLQKNVPHPPVVL